MKMIIEIPDQTVLVAARTAFYAALEYESNVQHCKESLRDNGERCIEVAKSHLMEQMMLLFKNWDTARTIEVEGLRQKIAELNRVMIRPSSIGELGL